MMSLLSVECVNIVSLIMLNDSTFIFSIIFLCEYECQSQQIFIYMYTEYSIALWEVGWMCAVDAQA